MKDNNITYVAVSINVLLNGTAHESIKILVEMNGQFIPVERQLDAFRLALKVKFGPRIVERLDKLVDYLTLRYRYNHPDAPRCAPEHYTVIDHGICLQWETDSAGFDFSTPVGKESLNALLAPGDKNVSVADALIQIQQTDAAGPVNMIILKPRPDCPTEGTYRIVGFDPKDSLND